MRSFRKYDDTLSYIGGLFSTFMVALFVMHTYNEYGFEVDIAARSTSTERRQQFLKVNSICFLL
jgi:hypothetical protein